MRSDDQHIRARAAQIVPATQRRVAVPDDVAVLTRAERFAGFFAVEEQGLRFRRFDGTLSDPVNREAFVSGDAVTVLPYDPVRDRVLLVEQFRHPAELQRIKIETLHFAVQTLGVIVEVITDGCGAQWGPNQRRPPEATLRFEEYCKRVFSEPRKADYGESS